MAIASADIEAAIARCEADGRVLLTARRVDDLETPVSAYLKLRDGVRHSCLLESVEGGAYRGRYSAIGLDPDLLWQSRAGEASIARADGFEDVPERFEAAGSALTSLKTLLAESALDMPEGLAPIAAGLFGYLGYDMIREVERLPATAAPDPLGTPDALLMRPRVMVVFDAIAQEITAAAPARITPGQSAKDAVMAAARRIEAVFARLEAPAPGHRAGTPGAPSEAPLSNTGDAAFRAHVETAKAYIRAGDAFQIVGSQRFSAPFALPPFALYRSLRRTNPSPFLFFFDLDGFAIAGSSPEILVRVRDGKVTVRPIAGTRPRGATPEQDAAYEAELKADPKELAEHLMLLDLGRNDVGRVAKPGSVRVTDRELIERYSHVMHIVSNVEGDLAEGEDAISALFAGFPAGTVSGAPKVRAMEIIEEMEPHRRGIYAGAVGYFGADGSLDTCIALRTAVIKDGMMHVQAGAGMVLDSDPESERLETVNKARAVFRAAEEAWRFA
ncbi:anthranilate synthase component I [Glycocaulis sp.]|uniref:anthranilate synthase component I n=1 Tax=Glycocaulis sp. TaxID=1969725 RepID=UPI0025BCB31A|nr:anthranilate synthase component I [Glycocaulis sp.]MCH8521390.1 anthranilate synthase component I [Glycocaulis sp.]